jgi:hypothetical protein
MNKLLIGIGLVLVSGISSCSKEAPVPLTRRQIQEQIDSITRIRVMEVDERAKKDLEHRIKIEVKIKADSILQAMKTGKTEDTTALQQAND